MRLIAVSMGSHFGMNHSRKASNLSGRIRVVSGRQRYFDFHGRISPSLR